MEASRVKLNDASATRAPLAAEVLAQRCERLLVRVGSTCPHSSVPRAFARLACLRFARLANNGALGRGRGPQERGARRLVAVQTICRRKFNFLLQKLRSFRNGEEGLREFERYQLAVARGRHERLGCRRTDEEIF